MWITPERRQKMRMKRENDLHHKTPLFGANRAVVWCKSCRCLAQIAEWFGAARRTTKLCG